MQNPPFLTNLSPACGVVQTLLLATTIDANHNILLLAWGIVESENIEFWAYIF